MKKLLTILGSLGMIVPVSASVVACNSPDDKETLRSSDQWGDGWGDENKQRPANPDDNWNDWDDIGDAGGRPVTPGDGGDDGDWGNDRDNDSDEKTIIDDGIIKKNFKNKDFEYLYQTLESQGRYKLWYIQCEIIKNGGFEHVVVREGNKNLAKDYAQIIFDSIVMRTKIFLQTDYIVEYHAESSKITEDIDTFFVSQIGDTMSKHPYEFWVKGTQNFMTIKLIDQVLKFYNQNQRDYLNSCMRQLLALT